MSRFLDFKMFEQDNSKNVRLLYEKCKELNSIVEKCVHFSELSDLSQLEVSWIEDQIFAMDEIDTWLDRLANDKIEVLYKDSLEDDLFAIKKFTMNQVFFNILVNYPVVIKVGHNGEHLVIRFDSPPSGQKYVNLIKKDIQEKFDPTFNMSDGLTINDYLYSKRGHFASKKFGMS